MPDYDNRDKGVLFEQTKKKSDRAPDWSGDMEFSKELLRKMIANAKADKPIKVKLAGWARQSKASGKNLISLTVQDMEVQEKPKAQPKDDLNDEVPF